MKLITNLKHDMKPADGQLQRPSQKEEVEMEAMQLLIRLRALEPSVLLWATKKALYRRKVEVLV